MYYDILARIKNAGQAEHDKLTAPFSKMDMAVCEALVKSGYLKAVEKKTVGNKKFIEITLAYSEEGTPAMRNFKLVSKPSRHLYEGYRNIRSVKQGYGTSIYSTSRGIMAGKEARKQKLGGEHLFEIW